MNYKGESYAIIRCIFNVSPPTSSVPTTETLNTEPICPSQLLVDHRRMRNTVARSVEVSLTLAASWLYVYDIEHIIFSF